MSENDSNQLQTQNPPAEPALQYLLVSIAGQEYGIRLDHLQEVLRYNPDSTAPVPNAPEWLEGIQSLRGTIISIVNLRVFLELSRFDSDDKLSQHFGYDLGIGFGRPVPRLLVAFKDTLVVGFLVDDIKGVVFVRPSLVHKGVVAHPAEKDAPALPDTVIPYLEGVYQDPETEKITHLIEVRKLIVAPRLLQFEPLEV